MARIYRALARATSSAGHPLRPALGIARRFLLAAGLASGINCDGDPVRPPTAGRTGADASGDFRSLPPEAAGRVPTAAERGSAERIARSLALGLRNPRLRQALKHAYASSSVKEGKLDLTSFLEGRGAELLASSAAAGGLDREGMRRELEQVRTLEFYMPVDEHRAAWSGNEPVLVAVNLVEEENPVAFNEQGDRISLSADAPPVQPVVAVVPHETSPGDQPAKNRRGEPQRACMAVPAETLAASMARCEGSAAGTSGASARGAVGSAGPALMSANAALTTTEDVGVHLTFMRVLNRAGEPWVRGSPEYEIWTMGRPSAADTHGRWLSCTGEDNQGAFNDLLPMDDPEYHYNQDNGFWHGMEKVMNQATNDSVLARNERFTMQLWEDDDYPCAMRTDSKGLQEALMAVGYLAGIGAQVVKPTEDPLDEDLHWALSLGPIVFTFALADWLANNPDDFVGHILDLRASEWESEFAPLGNTHVLVKQSYFVEGGLGLWGRATFQVSGVTPAYGTAKAIAIAVDDSSKMPVGRIYPFHAAVTDSLGRQVTGATVTWQSLNTSVATVSSTGSVSTVGAGTARIVASYMGLADSVLITALAYGDAVAATIDAADTVFVDVGDSVDIGASAVDANGFTIPDWPSWGSSNPNHVGVDYRGTLFGANPGTARIYADFETARDSILAIARSHIVRKTGWYWGDAVPGELCYELWATAEDEYFDGASTVTYPRPAVKLGCVLDNWERETEAERVYNEWVPARQP